MIAAWLTLARAEPALSPSRSTEEMLRAALAPRRVALVVGVDRYDDAAFPWLDHATDDASLLAAELRDPAVGGFDQVVALTDSPTRDQVMAGLREVTRDLRAEDVLLVYFSGHGTRVRSPTGATLRYLLERDSRAMGLDRSALELEALQAWFGGLPPARKVLIVDACFDGDGKSVLRPLDKLEALPADSDVPSTGGLGTGEAYLFATSPGRAALEDDRLGHGLYTYFLLDAMSWSFAAADRDQDGVVTAWEAHDHARSQVIAWSGGAQVPEAAFRVVGTADLVLAGDAGARREQDRSLVYLYAPASNPMSGGTLTVDGRPRGLLPGTIPVAPGRHHLELADRDGVALADGWLTLEPGHPYRADDLARLIRGPSAGFGLRSVAAVSGPLTGALGWGAVGVEGYGYLRDDRSPGRGVTVTGRIAALGAPRDAAPRAGLDAGVELGLQRDYRRLRGAVSATAGAVLLPPAGLTGDTIDPYAAPAQAGWLFATFGGSAALSVVASEAVSFGVVGRPQLTVLDVDGDGQTEQVPWVAVGAGVGFVLR